MRTAFKTPGDYLSHLKSLYALPYTDRTIVDDEFARITQEQMKVAGIDLPLDGTTAGIELAITSAIERIHLALPPELQATVRNNIATGVLESGDANAFIARSPDKKYAILFCSGLAMFLHKQAKLLTAFFQPDQVIYCNRKPAADVTRSDIEGYIEEITEYYSKNSVPLGPRIKLGPEGTARASSMLMSPLSFATNSPTS
jgi:hypothetical protein